MKAVVTGVIGTYAVGGVAWDYGQYALALEQLGFDVWYLEDAGLATYDAEARTYTGSSDYAVRFLRGSLETLSPSLADRWHFRSLEDETHGVAAEEMAEIVAEADLFLNVSGLCLLRDEYLPSRRKVMIDTDPGWNHFDRFPRADAGQLWPGTSSFRAHDHFFTYAESIGHASCRLPMLGIEWQPTRPPVVLDRWHRHGDGRSWTTVMTWDNYGAPIEHDGETYGSKEREFRRIEKLPEQVVAPLEVAVGGIGAPVEEWQRAGWSVRDSTDISSTADDYREYVERSRGELSVAKNVYVATGSGWFSCRSTCYLAAGRPVVVQETGFSQRIRTGDGLLSFTSPEEAARAIAAVEDHYEHHSASARELAATEFEASAVVGDILTRIGLG